MWKPVAVAMTISLFTGATQGRAPMTLIEAARLDPESFARALAAARVPAGLEVRDVDRPRSGHGQAFAPASPSLSLDDLVFEFNTAHPAYRGAVLNNVIAIGPLTSRARFLDAPVPPGRLVATGLMAALRKLFEPLDHTLSPTGGVLGSQIGSAVEIGNQVKVDIDVTGLTVRACLLRLSVLAPGHVWIVVTSGTEPWIEQVGFLHANGSGTYLRISRGELRDDHMSQVGESKRRRSAALREAR
jgi:hypothetical protein